jgi:hypothetical protein
MIFRSKLSALILAFAVTPSFAGPSDQHLARAANHSGQAVSHGSAAVSTGVATVTSVPILIVGSTLTVSGAALEEIGEAALEVRSDLYRAGTDETVTGPVVAPNGAPTLSDH